MCFIGEPSERGEADEFVLTTKYKGDSLSLTLEADKRLTAETTYTVPIDLDVMLQGEVARLCLMGETPAQSGSITITERSVGRIAGTYSLTFSGQTLFGSFDVSYPQL